VQKSLPKVKRSRLWALGRPERGYLVLALIACTFSGTVFPVFSLILSTIISFFYLDDADELEKKVGVVFLSLPLLLLLLLLLLLYSCGGGSGGGGGGGRWWWW
ncbi:unnamed protein product, partial [Laminaria digitata]